MLCGWWEEHGWEAVNPEMLAPVGIISEREGTPIAFCVIWPVAGVGIAIMEYIVADPEAKPIHVVKAIKELTGYVETWCREFDYGILFTSCKQPSLAKVHERNGFTLTDETMKHLVMVVEKEGK